MSNHWSILSLWNASFEARPPRKYEPRDYVYASELGSSMYDIYLKLQGVKPTNPPTGRALRKMEASSLFEWVLRFVLMRAGLLRSTQDKVKTQLKGCLAVSGKLDFIAGGTMDFEQAEREIADMQLPEFFGFACKRIIEHFKKQYGDLPLFEYILESKAVSTFVFDRNERAGAGNPNHEQQIYHYLQGKKMPQGKLLYICKDDCRLQEFNLYENSEPLACAYRQYLEKITDYYHSKKLPPKEKAIIFDDAACSFRANWKVEYSPYLVHYGYEMPENFRDRWGPFVLKINRVFKRCVNGDKITAANIEVIRDAKQHYPNWSDLVDIAKMKGVLIEEEEVETT